MVKWGSFKISGLLVNDYDNRTKTNSRTAWSLDIPSTISGFLIYIISEGRVAAVANLEGQKFSDFRFVGCGDGLLWKSRA